MSRLFFLIALFFGATTWDSTASGSESVPAQTNSNTGGARRGMGDSALCGISSNWQIAKEFVDFRNELSTYSSFCQKTAKTSIGMDSSQMDQALTTFYSRFRPHVLSSQTSFGQRLGEEQRQQPNGPYTARVAEDRISQYQDVVWRDYQARVRRDNEGFCQLPRIQSAFPKLRDILSSSSPETALCDFLKVRLTERANNTSSADWLRGSNRPGSLRPANSEAREGVARLASDTANTRGLKLTPTTKPLGISPIPQRIGNLFKGLWNGLSNLIKSIFGINSGKVASDPRFPKSDPNLRERNGPRQTQAGFRAPRAGAGGGIERDTNTNPRPAVASGGANTGGGGGATADPEPTAVATLETASEVTDTTTPPRAADRGGRGESVDPASLGAGEAVDAPPAPAAASLSSPAPPPRPQPARGEPEVVSSATSPSIQANLVFGTPLPIEDTFPEWLLNDNSPAFQQINFRQGSSSQDNREIERLKQEAQSNWRCLNQPTNDAKRTEALQRLRATDQQILALLQSCQVFEPRPNSPYIRFINSYRKQFTQQGWVNGRWADENLIPLEQLSNRTFIFQGNTTSYRHLCQKIANPQVAEKALSPTVTRIFHNLSKGACRQKMDSGVQDI